MANLFSDIFKNLENSESLEIRQFAKSEFANFHLSRSRRFTINSRLHTGINHSFGENLRNISGQIFTSIEKRQLATFSFIFEYFSTNLSEIVSLELDAREDISAFWDNMSNFADITPLPRSYCLSRSAMAIIEYRKPTDEQLRHAQNNLLEAKLGLDVNSELFETCELNSILVKMQLNTDSNENELMSITKSLIEVTKTRKNNSLQEVIALDIEVIDAMRRQYETALYTSALNSFDNYSGPINKPDEMSSEHFAKIVSLHRNRILHDAEFFGLRTNEMESFILYVEDHMGEIFNDKLMKQYLSKSSRSINKIINGKPALRARDFTHIISFSCMRGIDIQVALEAAQQLASLNESGEQFDYCLMQSWLDLRYTSWENISENQERELVYTRTALAKRFINSFNQKIPEISPELRAALGESGRRMWSTLAIEVARDGEIDLALTLLENVRNSQIVNDAKDFYNNCRLFIAHDNKEMHLFAKRTNGDKWHAALELPSSLRRAVDQTASAWDIESPIIDDDTFNTICSELTSLAEAVLLSLKEESHLLVETFGALSFFPVTSIISTEDTHGVFSLISEWCPNQKKRNNQAETEFEFYALSGARSLPNSIHEILSSSALDWKKSHVSEDASIEEFFSAINKSDCTLVSSHASGNLRHSVSEIHFGESSLSVSDMVEANLWPSSRLIFLNGCETTLDAEGLMAGGRHSIAGYLARTGVDIVIGAKRRTKDTAAGIISVKFFSSLLKHSKKFRFMPDTIYAALVETQLWAKTATSEEISTFNVSLSSPLVLSDSFLSSEYPLSSATCWAPYSMIISL